MSADLELVTLEEAACIVAKTPHNIRDYIQRGRMLNTTLMGKRSAMQVVASCAFRSKSCAFFFPS
ncbi:hypothetical protein CTKA_02854 [Chthonomonas calidirosea]|uniref:Helix-turn-helix domain-containing protein n=1 Tax=Chthonomonas calidirosea (strain DSM 23976 / ICMP 18418 / T49) TaxID=1303518 RepID=S0ETY0_CHTCT|nr:hypothetical protein CCALI_01246 [Chthonomonas calidirosea T49]CEK20920.1 hypothetical protein CTKA_02854 [Chthonomonas calidirosea]